MSINRVIEVGNITQTPELRETSTHTPVLLFPIAVNDRVKNPQTNEWESRPNFFDCVLYGNRANAIFKNLSVGMKVAIEGHLRWRQWEKDGQKRSRIEIIIDQVEFFRGREAQATNGGACEEPTYYDCDVDF